MTNPLFKNDNFYQGAPPSQSIGNLTQMTSATYSATTFIPGERNTSLEGPLTTERILPISMQYTIPKGLTAKQASQMLNAILTSTERPTVSLVGGTPERVRFEWYTSEPTPVKYVNDEGTDEISVRPEEYTGIFDSLQSNAALLGHQFNATYSPVDDAHTVKQFDITLPTWRKRPPVFKSLRSTDPLVVTAPKNLKPLIYIKGHFPKNSSAYVLQYDMKISVFYGLCVCDSAALSSAYAIGDSKVGGFWDWAAKILKIVVKVAEVVLPIIETLADPRTDGSTGVLEWAKQHPRYLNLTQEEKSMVVAKLASMLRLLQASKVPSLVGKRKRKPKGLPSSEAAKQVEGSSNNQTGSGKRTRKN